MALFSFRSGWEAAPQALPPDSMAFVIGDVHGHREHLDAMLGLLRLEIGRARERSITCQLVLLGDYVDRGPCSIGTLRRVAGILDAEGIPVHALCGNHDHYLIEFLFGELPNPEALEVWCGNGGLTTLAELGIDAAELVDGDLVELAARARVTAGPEAVAMLSRLQLYRTIGGYVCVHAGINPGRPLGEHGRGEFLWLREPFLGGRGWKHPFTAVHGHTIRGPEVLPHRIAVGFTRDHRLQQQLQVFFEQAAERFRLLRQFRQDGRQRAALLVHVAVFARQISARGLFALLGRRARFDQPEQLRAPLDEDALQRFQHQRVLVLEVGVEAADREAGAGHDLTDRRCTEAATAQRFRGRSEDAGAGFLFLFAARDHVCDSV